ncbi:MAG: hypothetical protein ACI9U1_000695 [Porticoccaceae bacterium]|jgi:hypothetical protein
MQDKKSVIAIFEAMLNKSSDPFISSMQGLPVNVLDSLLVDLVNRSEITCDSETLSIAFDVKAFKQRVKGAFQREVLGDEVGVLIQFGASKNVISEVTGVHQTTVKSRRKLMVCNHPMQGRPWQLDNGQKKFITDCWNKFSGNNAVKLVRTHHFTEIPINDVWLVVKDLKPAVNTDVSEQSNNRTAQ